MRSEAPQLTVVVPTLNEAVALPLLLEDLAAQTGVVLEVLVSDGGSTDGTPQLATTEMARLGVQGAVLTGAPGRGRQLNLGASRARGSWLLFVHADSRMPAPETLRSALSRLAGAGSRQVAGHFALRFALPEDVDPLPYRYCEIKARLGLPGTIHGDQGFLLSTFFFRELGGFREDLPVLEDTLLAEQIRSRGEWHLLPGEVVTSPRRFLVEGFRQRQTLNALLMNFALTGWFEPLQRAPEVYLAHDRSRPLQLAPFYRLLDRLLNQLPLKSRLRLWYRTGEFVRSNAWQLQLWRMMRRGRLDAEPSPAVAVNNFRRRFDLLTAHPPGRLLAALLTWTWFRTRSRRDSVL